MLKPTLHVEVAVKPSKAHDVKSAQVSGGVYEYPIEAAEISPKL